jgi:peptidyl-tRNA hydrolase, PTH1 family
MVLGIGNVGAEYGGTRHNVGFDVVDRLAARFKARPRAPGPTALVAHTRPFGEEVVFVKPGDYVNRSGEAAERVLRKRGGTASDLLVVCDDINLPPGRIRIRGGGSDGGHKGLRSIIGSLGTDAFARLRVGVGMPPPHVDAAEWVLDPPSSEEKPMVAEAVERAADAVTLWLQEGRLDACMSRYNA